MQVLRRNHPVPVLILVLAALVAGCSQPDTNVVYLSRQLTDDSDLTTPAMLHWLVGRACFTAGPRGDYELLVEAPPPADSRPIRQVLYVRVLWDIHPPQVGNDPSAVNAHVGYFVQTGHAGPTGSTLYYEGMGNVFIDRPNWLGGRLRFRIRHATLRLARSTRDKSVDPLGLVEVQADVVAGADPTAAAQIAPVVKLIRSLPPPGEKPPAPPATAPATSEDRAL